MAVTLASFVVSTDESYSYSLDLFLVCLFGFVSSVSIWFCLEGPILQTHTLIEVGLVRCKPAFLRRMCICQDSFLGRQGSFLPLMPQMLYGFLADLLEELRS